jgi:glycosyltransferase involved in cell wall biosynthesis
MSSKLMKRKHVLVLVRQMDGGTGTFVEQLIRLEHMFEGEMSVSVVALETPQFRDSFKRIHVSFVGNPNSPTLLTVVRQVLWLKQQVTRAQPDVVLSVNTYCNVLICLYRILFFWDRPFRIILTIHNNISAVADIKLPSWSRRMFRVLCHHLFFQANAVVCVSKGVAREARQYFSLHRPPLIIPVSVNIQHIRTLAAAPLIAGDRLKFQTNETKILSIGRFDPQKDFVTLIEAFALVQKTNANTGLYLIGDGPEKKKIVACIKRHHLEKHIHLLGWKQNVYPYIKAADMFVLSSNYEGFPYVLLEAAALEKPIIATDTPYGPKEFLGNNTYGLVVPMKDSAALANAVELFLDSKYVARYSSRSAGRAIKFSEENMLRQYKSILVNSI